jgi:hypothetical protein
VRIDPAYAEAYAGVAITYNLLCEYAGMSDAQAFGLAKTASKQALRLNPNLAGAHAFVLFWGDFKAAIVEYQRALQPEPGNPHTHHWLTTPLNKICDTDQPGAQRSGFRVPARISRGNQPGDRRRCSFRAGGRAFRASDEPAGDRRDCRRGGGGAKRPAALPA